MSELAIHIQSELVEPESFGLVQPIQNSLVVTPKIDVNLSEVDLESHRSNYIPNQTLDHQSIYRYKKYTIHIILGGLLMLILAFTANSISNNSYTCIGQYFNINFQYDTWLNIFGSVNMLSISFGLYLYFFQFTADWKHWNDFKEKICLIFFCIMYLFNFAWYIVGAILYFNTVFLNCERGQSIHDFGLALFIIQTIHFCYIYFFFI